MIKCVNCGKNPATRHETLGYVYCDLCITRQRTFKKPNDTIELATEDLKNDRRIYRKDTLQPYRGGKLSKEYIEAYGTDRIVATPEEIKQAQNVWDKDDPTQFYKKD
jgi:hypothetical protein